MSENSGRPLLVPVVVGVVLFAGLTAILGSAGCYHITVQVTWPKEPLRVVVVHQGGGAVESSGAADDGGAPDDIGGGLGTPPPVTSKPVTQSLGPNGLFLTDRGRVVFVEYAGGSDYSRPLRLFEVNGSGAAACLAAAGKNELWTLPKGRRWDAQYLVPAGKSVCAESASGGGGDGDVTFLVR